MTDPHSEKNVNVSATSEVSTTLILTTVKSSIPEVIKVPITQKDYVCNLNDSINEDKSYSGSKISSINLLCNLFYYCPENLYTHDMFSEMWNTDKNEFVNIMFYLRSHRRQINRPQISDTSSKDRNASEVGLDLAVQSEVGLNLVVQSEVGLNLVVKSEGSAVVSEVDKTSLCLIVGRGQRKIFYKVIIWMSYYHLPELLLLLPYIPDYGYWKDLLVLMGTPAESAVVELFGLQLVKDYDSFHSSVPGLVSMAAKWTPNEGSSSDRIHNTYAKIAKFLRISRKILRTQYLVPLRKYLSITEQLTTNKKWLSVNYNTVPQMSLKLHTKSFMRNDSERFIDHINRNHINYTHRLVLPPLVNKVLLMNDNSPNKAKPCPVKVPLDFLPSSISVDLSSKVIRALDISGSMAGLPITLGACLCAEDENPLWIPFQFDANPKDNITDTIKDNSPDKTNVVDDIISAVGTNKISYNLDDCLRITRILGKSHLLIISNILLDESELPRIKDESRLESQRNFDNNVSDPLGSRLDTNFDSPIRREFKESCVHACDSKESLLEFRRDDNGLNKNLSNELIHVTYWSVNLNPVTIIDYPHLTVIEGYDAIIYDELRSGHILTRLGYKNIVMNKVRSSNVLPIL